MTWPRNQQLLAVSTACLVSRVAIGSVFVFPNFTSTNGLTLNGSAVRAENVLRLTDAIGSQGGTAWYTASRLDLSAGFESRFTYRAGGGPGTGGDGFAFVIQDESPSAAGPGAGSLAYAFITRCIAVEFDTFQNGPSISDPNANHVSVQTRGIVGNSAQQVYSIGWATPTFNINDIQSREIVIRYIPGQLTVAVAGNAPFLSVAVNLQSIDGNSILGPAGRAWVGFSAGTGGAVDRHDILNWKFQSFAFAGCISDVGRVGGAIGPDDVLSADDIVVYLAAFFAADVAVADLVAVGGPPGGDGQVTVDDLVFFLAAFFNGCP